MLDKHGVTLEQVREYTQKRPEYTHALRKIKHHHGASTAVNFVAEVAGEVK